ncbi:MAG: NAD(P)-dependent alcohol dehydrogenase [Dehalococcoidales bacterium]|nr:MAG: NAD(P)-dependent alcohol dehydrogenase [Dehalococcoidales bacterium]
MKAVACYRPGPPEVMEIIEVDKPLPRDSEVLVKIHASAVTAVDTSYRRPVGNISEGKPRLRRLGYYFAGEVEDVGRKVTKFKKGDSVYGGDVWSPGAYAEYKCLKENGIMARKPANISYEEAVTIPYGGTTALPFLRTVGRIKAGKKVLVIGASGGIGIIAVQLARYFGAEVTGSCSTAGVEMVKSLGVIEVIDYSQEDFTRNGEKYDIIFDTPAKSSFSQCRNSLTKNGKYLTTVPWPRVLLQMFRTPVTSRKKAIFAPMGTRPPFTKRKDLEYLNELIENGHIKPVVDRVFPLEQIVEAHRYAENEPKKGNIVISIA